MSIKDAVVIAALDAELCGGIGDSPESVMPYGIRNSGSVPYSTDTLKGWQREAMTARIVIVSTIERLSRTTGASLRAVIERFILAQRASRLAAHLMRAAAQANERKGGARGLSAPTIYNWFKKYKEDGHLGLAPKAREAQGEIPLWAPLFLDLYRRPSKPSISACMREMGPEAPPEHQVRRFISKFSNLDIQRGRRTGAELRAIRAYTKRDFSMLLPCDIYVADGHSFKSYVAHPDTGKRFLPEIETVIDVATRACTGWSTGLAESGQVVADGLRHAVTVSERKPMGGLFAILYVDRGAGNRARMNSDEVTGIVARCGGTIRFGLAGNPQGRGVIERLNRTLWIPAAKKLLTYNGKDMDQLSLRKRIKIIDKDLKDSGASKMLIPWRDFIAFIGQEVEAYNNRPHSSLPVFMDRGARRHMTPLERWRAFEAEGFRPELLNEEEMTELFRPQAQCTTRRGLVTVRGNEYFSAELEHHHAEAVLVNYDIHDPEVVWVRDMEQRLICTARWNANRRHFYAVSEVAQARMRRRDRRLSLKQRQIAEIEEEAMGGAIEVERIPEEAVRIGGHGVEQVGSRELGVGSIDIRDTNDDIRTTTEERPFFGDDIERYDWHLQNGFSSEEDLRFKAEFERSDSYRMLYPAI